QSSSNLARFSIQKAALQTAQVNEGEVLSEFDVPENILGQKEKNVVIKPTQKSVEKGSLLPHSVEPDNLVFVSLSNNHFNKNTVTLGKRFDATTEELIDDASWVTSDFISVDRNTTYAKTSGQIIIALYNRQKVLIKVLSLTTSTFTTYKNVDYIRFSVL